MPPLISERMVFSIQLMKSTRSIKTSQVREMDKETIISGRNLSERQHLLHPNEAYIQYASLGHRLMGPNGLLKSAGFSYNKQSLCLLSRRLTAHTAAQLFSKMFTVLSEELLEVYLQKKQLQHMKSGLSTQHPVLKI